MIVSFSPINPVSNLHSARSPRLCHAHVHNDIQRWPCWQKQEPVGHQNLLPLSLSFFFFFFKTKTTWPPLSAPSPPTHREREGGRSNSKMRGPALLSALHQETECERAARHHTEAPLKIHVYHSSSFIDGLSSLYVYEVRGLPVAPGQWPTPPPPVSTGVSKKLPVPFNLASF